MNPINPNWIGSTEDDEIYKENIIDHYKHPRNHKKLENATIHKREYNPTCGDAVDIYLMLTDNMVNDATFIGNGCAISQAATSMLTEYIQGKTVNELKQLTKEDIFKLLGITLSVVRMRCALLSLTAVHNGLTQWETS